MSVNEVRGVDLITQVFSPKVAVLSTSEAEQLAQKNNLSLVQLLRPFAQMRTDAVLRDPYNNTVHEVRNLKLRFECMDNPEAMSDAVAVNQLLNAVVYETLTKQTNASKVTSKYGNYHLHMHSSAPWFEAFRTHFTRTLPISEHEFSRHFVACLIVVSSSEPDVKLQFKMLEKKFLENVSELGPKKWFMSEILCCRVLIHDVAEGDEKAASELMQELKNEIGRGPHLSYLLSINSRRGFEVQELTKSNKKYGPKMVDPWKRFLYESVGSSSTMRKHHKGSRRSSNQQDNLEAKLANGNSDGNETGSIEHPLQRTRLNGSLDPDSSPDDFSALEEPSYHGLYLTSADQEMIRSFVDDFIRRALLPHYEKKIRELYDQLVAKKAITKSFFSATKKWLAAGKSAAYPLHFGSAESANFYPPEASEVQLRKLGDLAFLFQMYDIAYNIYYQCKGDFSGDGAHLFHAGSLEMTVFCQFLLGKSPTTSYIDTAISTYLYQCRNYNYALRCSLLCSDILLCKSVYSEALNNFLKLTTEDSDLKSALLLEQIAFCYINARGFAKPRKFAFYMILAGYRYNKADQKHHLLRTYDLAHQVFQNSSWTYAEDNILVTIAKNAHIVGKLEASTQAYLSLLNTKTRHSSTQQVNFFQDFINCFKDYIDSSRLKSKGDTKPTSLPEVCLPLINSQAVVVTYGALQRDNNIDAPNIKSSHWVELEKAATMFVTGAKQIPITWKPSIQMLSQTTDNKVKPRTARNEPVTLKLQFENPMKFHLYLENIHLLWRLKASDKDCWVENEWDVLEGSKYIKTEVIRELSFDNLEIKSVSLSLVPCVEGDVHIVGVAYNVCSGSLETSFNRKIVRVKQNLEVVGPKLNNSLSDRLANATGPDFRLQFSAVSQQPLLEIQFSPLPTELLSGEIQTARVTFHNRGQLPITSILVSSKDVKYFAFGAADPNTFGNIANGHSFTPSSVREVFALDLPNGALLPGQGATMSFWVRGMDIPGLYSISILFLYKNANSDQSMPHRIVKKSFEIEIRNSLALNCIKNRNFDQSVQMIFSMSNTLESQMRPTLGLTSLVCVSKNWRLKSSVATRSSETGILSVESSKHCSDYVIDCVMNNCKICEQEQMHFAVTLERITEPGDYVTSMISSDTSGDVKCHPFSEFLARNTTMFVEKKQAHPQTFDSKQYSMSFESAQSSYVEPAVDLTIVFVWNLSFFSADRNVVAFGQHHFSVDEIDYESSVSPIPEVALIQNSNLPYLVRYEIKYDSTCTHKIQNSFVRVPVKIRFHNCSEKPIEVKLFLPESPTAQSVFTLERLGVRESFSFWWVCKSIWVLSLPALASLEVDLQACFFKPGTYNLNNVTVLASFNPSIYKFVEQDCRFAAFITIN